MADPDTEGQALLICLKVTPAKCCKFNEQTLGHPDMVIDEIHYRTWRIEVLQAESGWKALVYRPSSPLHEIEVPEGSDRRAAIGGAKTLIDKLLAA